MQHTHTYITVYCLITPLSIFMQKHFRKLGFINKDKCVVQHYEVNTETAAYPNSQ